MPNGHEDPPTHEEIEGSKVVRLLDELDGKGEPDPNSFHDGCDRRVCWHNSDFNLAEQTGLLYTRLERCRIEITEWSLEMQTWWRDRQIIHAKREERRAQEAATQALRETGAAKLTDAEREALGL